MSSRDFSVLCTSVAFLASSELECNRRFMLENASRRTASPCLFSFEQTCLAGAAHCRRQVFCEGGKVVCAAIAGQVVVVALC